MKEIPIIVSCEISPLPVGLGDPLPRVSVTFNDGSNAVLFEYFPDEVSFATEEFIGLTEIEARQLFGRKDRAYLKGSTRR